MKNRIAQSVKWIFIFISTISLAQNSYRFHSHNDYLQDLPFWEAYTHGAGSIEADVFLVKNRLYVAHTMKEIDTAKTLEKLYLMPLSGLAKEDKLKELQLLIDLKSEAGPTLDKLIDLLKDYPELSENEQLSIVISGNRPAPSDYKNYPDFIKFDFQDLEHSEVDLSKVALISHNFKQFSGWNGLGRLTSEDLEKVERVIEKAHAAGKPIRFWGAPDTKTAWSRFAEMGIDFINTDHPAEASAHLKSLDYRTFTLKETVPVYAPEFAYNEDAKPKNIILMIGDGNGLGQISAAMIANRGELTLSQLKEIGLVKTSSFDDLVTDSAAGATAMATGKKANNRAIGTGPAGERLTSLTEILTTHGFVNGIITTDKITGATPSSFYAHVAERDNSKAILQDLKQSKINFFVSAGGDDFEEIQREFANKNLSDFNDFEVKTAVYLSEERNNNSEAGTEPFSGYVRRTLENLENQEKPYFLMIEGAKIDSNGHSNNVEGIVREMLDFDKAIAEVLKAADKNNNTLVIITADHETSGFGITQGNLKKGRIEGGFLTNDHTATMVPLFSYGPKSHNFNGVYENTEVFNKILEALEIED